MNPYQVLGVSSNASEDAIKKAYRKAAKECHPDTHPGDKKAEERFKVIGEAYHILSDRQRRKEYDEKTKQRTVNGNKEKPHTVHKAGFVYPGDLEKEFEKFFSMGKTNKTDSKEETKKQQNIKSMDVSSLFERYMGFK